MTGTGPRRRLERAARTLAGIALSVLSGLAVVPAVAGQWPSAATIAELQTLPEQAYAKHARFSVTGLVTHVQTKGVLAEDGEHGLVFSFGVYHGEVPAAGSLVRIDGYCELEYFAKCPFNRVTSIEVLGTAPVPPPEELSIAEVLRLGRDFRRVRVRGTVRDAFPDELDSRCCYIILTDNGAGIPVTFWAMPLEFADSLIDAEIEVEALASPFATGLRSFIGSNLSLAYDEGSLRVITPAAADPFDCPQLEGENFLSPTTVASRRRRRTTGTVLAVRNDGTILLQEPSGRVIGIHGRPQPGTAPVRKESALEVVGFPMTDLLHLSLERAVYRSPVQICKDPKLANAVRNSANAVRNSANAVSNIAKKVVSVREILKDDSTGGINAKFHGAEITIRGTVRSWAEDRHQKRLMVMESEGVLVEVECGSVEGLPEVPSGSVVEVTGVCAINTEMPSSLAIMPKILGFSLVLTAADGIEVVVRPPWWTPQRFAMAAAGFLLLLALVLVWNILLRRLVNRRSRELLRSQTETIISELRTEERSRMAAELHDNLSQSLTAISYRLTAARKRASEPEVAGRLVETAARMLGSCRTELRRCIWDLKSRALEEKTFEGAIRRTLQRIADAEKIAIDFPVPRSRVSDTTAHTILTAIRELVANAVFRGGAEHVTVSGRADGRRLRIEVADDGCGFEPAKRPGSDEGHFGLDNLRERIEKHGGVLEIRSAPGAGSRISIVLPG